MTPKFRFAVTLSLRVVVRLIFGLHRPRGAVLLGGTIRQDGCSGVPASQHRPYRFSIGGKTLVPPEALRVATVCTRSTQVRSSMQVCRVHPRVKTHSKNAATLEAQNPSQLQPTQFSPVSLSWTSDAAIFPGALHASRRKRCVGSRHRQECNSPNKKPSVCSRPQMAA